MNKCLRRLGCCLICMALPRAAFDGAANNGANARTASDNAERVALFPKLSVGQTFRYQIGYRAGTDTTTESSVAAPMAPTGGQTNENLLLQVEVDDLRMDAGKTVVRLRTRIIEPAAVAADVPKPANSAPDPNAATKPAEREKIVDFVLHADGQVTDLEGLDKLSPGEQAAWQEWLARFGGAASVPEKGIKPGEKWKTEEPISNALLTGLSWEKESEYVKDAPCAATKVTPQGDLADEPQAQETCAVILTTAILKQRSSQKDATPEDYKLHDLRTMGVASGKNEIVTYISLQTGFVVRANEDALQSMNVIVATTDGSNRVHYIIEAESHAQVLLLAPETPPNP
jgi:hypothetical protein